MPEQEKFYGIKELYRPIDREAEIDIVAVHGLNGDARKTWTAKKSKACWLDHPEFLPKYVKNARILVWGYNASFSSVSGEHPSKDRIHHHAHTLVSNLSADRRLAGMADKPIIFLCHSLGGIVVKRALSYSQTRTAHKVAHEHKIFSCTYGLLFFGTPHHGSSLANWLGYLKKLASQSDLVSALETESETLQNITDYFVPLMKYFSICFFWEQEKTDFKLQRDYVVASESAAPVYDETERAGIAADHSGMVKFEDPSHQGFRTVVDALLRYCDEAPSAIGRRGAHAADMIGRERQREAIELMTSIQALSFNQQDPRLRVHGFDDSMSMFQHRRL